MPIFIGISPLVVIGLLPTAKASVTRCRRLLCAVSQTEGPLTEHAGDSCRSKPLARMAHEARFLQQQCDHSQRMPTTLRGSSAEFSCKRQQPRTQPTGNCPRHVLI